MPRKRNPENIGLPKRWRHFRGAYFYQVPRGLEHLWDGKKSFRLGKTLPEAYREWATRLEETINVITVADLLDRYALEVVPHKAKTTQFNDVRYISKLKLVFGNMPITAIEPNHMYTYHTNSNAKALAHKEIKCLSHAYTMAVQWGLLKTHPFKWQLRLPGNGPRTRYVEDWEIEEFLSLKSDRKRGSALAIQAYTILKLLTGMSKSDLLRLKPAENFKDDGIHIQRHKTANRTGKRTIYTWTPELREAVQRALDARPVDISPWVFCNRFGQPYISEKTGLTSSWDTIWQRYMSRVMNETKVTERFTEHDLRAKAGSDAESDEHGRALLSHADVKTTKKFYRRKPDVVTPISRKGKLNSATHSE